MNILMFLTPKENVKFIEYESTLRQAIEVLDESGYSAIPIVDENGKYINTITEGDVLRYVKKHLFLDLKKAEGIEFREVQIKKNIKPISVYKNMDDLLDMALNQNFVPVVDDEDHFIGIITRKSIMLYFHNKYFNK